jgi:hypothetical protein
MYSNFAHSLHCTQDKESYQNEYSATIVSRSLVLVWACCKWCHFLILIVWIFVILSQKKQGILGMFFGPNSCTRKGHTLRFNVHYFTWWCILNQENMGGTNFGVRDRTNSFDGSRFRNLYLTVDLHYTRFSKCFKSNGQKLPCIGSTATDAQAYRILESEYHWAVRWRVRSDGIYGFRGTHQTARLSHC